MFSSGSRNRTRILVACLASGTATLLWSQAAAPRPPAPAIGKSLRYCNPLPIEASSRDGSPQGIGLGDVTVVREANKYYLFATGGGAWVSSDLVDWKYQAVEVRGSRIPVAPHVFKYKGAFYLSGNSAPLYKASDILGPYELVGPWKNEKGEPWKGVSNGTPWNGAFDVDMFLDDDGKPYLYYPARSTDGIYVAPLKPAESDTPPSLTIDMGSTTEFAKEQLFTVDSSRIVFIAGRGGFGARGGRAAGQQTAAPQIAGSPAFRYKIESSLDGESFTTILDQTGNRVTKYIEFDELPPTACRFVRLTITDWPHIADSPLGITEFTVFGKALETPNR